MRTNALLLGLPVALWGASAPAWAHDFWVHPERFVVGAEGPRSIEVQLKVGAPGDVKAVTPTRDRILRFHAVAALPRDRAPIALPPPSPEAPASRIDLTGLSGDVLLVYEGNHKFIELEGPKFERYLEHEGLEAIRRLRTERKQSDAPGRERYARGAKALLTVGTPSKGYGQRLGLPLELIPLDDPREPKKQLRFQLLFRGQALAGARVDRLRLDNLKETVHAFTDKEGVVRLPPPDPGAHMVAATYMVEAPETDTEADWVSEWATYAFEVRR